MSYYNGYRYTFNWEQGRQLDSLTYNGHTTSYQYNHDGIRTRKTKSDGSYVVYDIVDGTAVGETHYNSAGTATMYMMYIHDENGAGNGIGLWYPSVNAWAYYYFVKNLQGDVLEVYNEDHGCVASYSYDSWGNILTKSGSLADINPFRYRGYYFDTETWFYYLQSRYYDPAIGRFINADDADLLGANGDFASLNLFAYCGNNPVSRCDTSGRFWSALAGAAVGATIGAGSQMISNIITNIYKGEPLFSNITSGIVEAAIGGAFSGLINTIVPNASTLLSVGMSVAESVINDVNTGADVGTIVVNAVVSAGFEAISDSGNMFSDKTFMKTTINAMGDALTGFRPKVRKSALRTLKKSAKTVLNEIGVGIVEDLTTGYIAGGTKVIAGYYF